MRFIISFTISICTISSNGQSIFNAQTISGTQNNYIGCHVRDQLGNTYLNVFTNGGQNLSIYGKNYNLSAGNYILRFDASDSLTLIYNASSLGEVQAIAADKYGNIYVASEFLQYTFKYSKLGPSGNILWQVKGDVSFDVVSNQILVDDQGNSYVAGGAASGSFLGVKLLQYVCCPSHFFLLKFSPAGSLTWMRTPEASDYDSRLEAIRFDNNGNIILGGDFHTTIKMGSFSLSNLIGNNFSNMYMSCISPDGDVLWLKGFQGEGYFSMQDIEVDKDGNFYFCGGFYGTTTFGNVTASTLSYGAADFIVGKLSSNFDVQWVKFKETNISVANFRSLGGYLANTSNGVLISGVAYSGFQIDNNKFLPASSNLQAFITSINAEGSVLWLKGFGDALYPGTYSDQATGYYTAFKSLSAGYQLSKISEQCYFISGNFVSTLDTYDGLIQAQARDVFTGIFSETTPASIDLGPDVSVSFCGDASYNLKLNSALGNNYFLPVQGKVPTITFLNDSVTQLSNIDFGVTKFKWVVQNCATSSSKIIAINRIAQPNRPMVSSPVKYCSSELSGAVITLSGSNIFWYSDLSLSHQIAIGSSLVPTASDTLYAISAVNGCVSEPTKVIISIIDNPTPPKTESFSICSNDDLNLTATGQNLSWYSSSSSQTPFQTGSMYKVNYTNPGNNEIYVSQKIDGCESGKSIITINVTEFSLDDVFIPNVITPNGDQLNEEFYIMPFSSESCAGEFKSISIVNRWGTRVFYETYRNFRWGGEESFGTYYYFITFEKIAFKGLITVLK